MSGTIVVASFATEKDLMDAVRAVRDRDCDIVDVFTPYAVHGLEKALGWPRSQLPVACFLCGAAGAGLALWFQFWTSATDWPMNVGGRPWNSLPAFVPVAFETMVLFAGFGLAFAWLARCRLYPGKKAILPMAGVTDDRFALAIRKPDPAAGATAIRELFQECHAVDVQEQDEEAHG